MKQVATRIAPKTTPVRRAAAAAAAPVLPVAFIPDDVMLLVPSMLLNLSGTLPVMRHPGHRSKSGHGGVR